MLTHSQIWAAIDTLASRHGMTASGLARKAGLDPTTFNRSKRQGPDGRLRWPSTESLAKILHATSATLDEFMGLLTSRPETARRIPLIGMAQAGDGDVVIVSPNSPVRRGDRVVMKTREGEVLAKELKRRTAKTIELRSINPEHPDRAFDVKDVQWIARIVWAAQ
jgi:phage repressor protein C with HTH and peptisase S24 domain